MVMEGTECVTGNVPAKLCQDNSDLLKPQLLTVSHDIDGLDDLPDVGAVLERSGILESTADGGTPNSLKCFDISDFTVEDSNSGLPFDGILDLPSGSSSSLPQNLPPPPSTALFFSNGQGPQPLPYFAHLPLHPVMQKQNAEILGGLNAFSANLLAVPHLVMNQGITPTTCSQKLDGPKFVSSILSGSDESKKLGCRSRNGKNRPADGLDTTFPNNREAPEYQRVMDILTEYRVQVAEKSAEALMPCKRRKSRPLVDVVEIAKSASTAGGAVSSSERSPGKYTASLPPQQHGRAIDQPGDLSSSDSLVSNGSATDLPRMSEQNTSAVIYENGCHVPDHKPVMGCASDIAVLQTAVSQGLSCNREAPSIQNNGHWKEITEKHQKPSCNVSSTEDSSPSKVTETPVRSCKKVLELPPECHCSVAGRYSNKFPL